MIILGLGSNLGDREQNMRAARTLLAAHDKITIERFSALYETEPVGVKDQPLFLNAVILIKTTLSPQELLAVCLNIEKQLGRIREKRWGPRIIDIDILIYNDFKIHTEQLSIPHPRLGERRFVLLPLAELVGDLPVVNGMSARELLATLPDDSAVRLYCAKW